MAESEIEVQASARIKDSIKAAVEKIGKKEFASLSGLEMVKLESLFETDGTYVKVTVVSLACQVNKGHGDPEPSHSSISECLRGAIYRIPGHTTTTTTEAVPSRRITLNDLKPRRAVSAFTDQKSVKIANLSASTISFLVLFYFLGGFVLGPLFGLSPCEGLTPCMGSAIGLVLGAVAGLAYITYYFVKKV